MPMTMRIPNLITLNGVALTDESREPISEERDERSVPLELASGKKRKWIKTIAKRWTIDWENVDSDASKTIDGLAGRDGIRAIVQSGSTMPLVIKDGNTTETYTVFVDSYTESLTMRRFASRRYKISMTLEEQV